MFTVIFHDEAEKEFVALPAAIRAKMSRILVKLEANPISTWLFPISLILN